MCGRKVKVQEWTMVVLACMEVDLENHDLLSGHFCRYPKVPAQYPLNWRCAWKFRPPFPTLPRGLPARRPSSFLSG